MSRPALLAAFAAAGVALAALAAPSANAGDAPVARAAGKAPTVKGWAISNPGVIPATTANLAPLDVVLETGSWKARGTISISKHPEKPKTWKRVTSTRLLDHLPAKASAADALWAPSGIGDGTTGRYYVFYSAPVAGHTHDSTHPPRCIFTGTSRSNILDPRADVNRKGLFVANDQPLVCWKRSGTTPADKIGRPAKGFSLIDPTPTILDGQYFLTYKTQYKSGKNWVTTSRMVKLDPTNPGAAVIGKDKQLVHLTSSTIEENPVMVQHGSHYVLFTSRGWYHSNCHTSPHPYKSYYRVSSNKWSWSPKKAPLHLLKVPSGTCGTGNAQPVLSGDGQDRFFFNGRWRNPVGALHLFVGALTWSAKDHPRVTTLFP